MKQTLTRLWRTSWGKALFAASYSLASVLVYFALAQIAYGLWGSTWLPPIGRPPAQEQASTISPAEMQRLEQFIPFQPQATPPPQAAPVVQVAPVVQAPPPTQDTSGLGPPPLPGQTH